MKEIFITTLKFFIFFALGFGFCLSLAFGFYSGNILQGFSSGMFGGVLFGGFMSAYLLTMLLMFKARLFLYSNLEKELNALNSDTIIHDSLAANETRGRVKYGALFLSDAALIFIPHRFAIKPVVVNLPLEEVTYVSMTRINIFKIFAGGLKKRLLIETIDGSKYIFRVLQVDFWVRTIRGRVEEKKGSDLESENE